MEQDRPTSRIQSVAVRENRAILTMAVMLCIFLGLTALARSSLLLAWDRGVTLGLQAHRSPELDAMVSGVSFLGNWPSLAAAALLGAFVCGMGRRPRAAVLAVLTLTAFPLNYLLKTIVGRPRPSEGVAVLQQVSGLSFPSGHSMTSVAVLGFLAFLAWTHITRPALRWILAAALSVLAVLIGLSRIYLGAHWLSDVVAGWTVGLCLALLFAEVYKARAGAELRSPE